MKKLIVAGGGIAGKTIINELQKMKADLQITLIEPKEYLEVPYARLRALVNPKSFSPQIRKKYSEMLTGINHIKDKVKSVEETRITLENGQKLEFDFLVLATGAQFNNWDYLNSRETSSEERQKAVEKENSKLEAAETILIIGGGPVGVELAGEIAHSYPDKKVKIAQGGKRILGPALSEKMTDRALRFLSEMNVEIQTDIRFTQNKDGNWQDDKGVAAQADWVIPAVGTALNSKWARASGNIEINDHNAVKVDEELRIPGRKNVFALGDVNDVPEMKLGAFTVPQAKLTAANIMKLLSNENAVLKKHKPSPAMGFVTLGPEKTAVQLPFGHPHFLGVIKQKDLFASKNLK